MYAPTPSLPVVADFSSEDCKPCKAIAPVFQELAAALAERAVFVTIDINKVPAVRDLRGVVAVPTFQAISPQAGADLFCVEGADEGKLRALVCRTLGVTGGDKMESLQRSQSTCCDEDSKKT